MTERGEKNLGWFTLSFLLIPFLRSVATFRLGGLERIPKSGAFVAAPNHMTDFDPLVIAYVVWRGGRVPRFLAKASLFEVPALGWLLRKTGQVPVHRAGGGHEPLAAAARIVERGQAVIVYPEGTLTRDPDLWPMRGKSGAVRLALQHGIPIVPIAHWGVQRILPRWSKKISLRPRKRVDVLVGEPVDLSRWAGRNLDPETLEEATSAVMAAITDLVARLRGETPPVERWDPSAHDQPEFGRPDSD